MGPPPDPEQMITMLENPQFQSTMNEALQNPQLIDMMIQQNPMLREMGPNVRQMMGSPEFRRILTDPNAIRQMTQMQRAMGMGGPGDNEAFPAPGVTNTTPEENRGAQNPTEGNTAGAAPPPFNMFAPPGGQGGAANPFAALLGGNPPPGGNPSAPPAPGAGSETTQGQGEAGGNAANPFASLFNPALFGQPPQGGDANAQNTQTPPNPFANLQQNNPFLQDPALLSRMMQAMGGPNQGTPGAPNAEGGQNPLAGLFGGGGAGGAGFGAPPAETDNRPPEDRYAEQLRQLNDMGFYEFERNIEALRRAGGSVQGAVEYLLTH